MEGLNLGKDKKSVQIILHGIVQGVGFRPFVYRLATELSLSGTVCNTLEGLLIEAEGPSPNVDKFTNRLKTDFPKGAQLKDIQINQMPTFGHACFTIGESISSQPAIAGVPSDLAICSECENELFDPKNRRYHYPFINCTACGPRFSIIESLPYDRFRTTMKNFDMCKACRLEFMDKNSRRFHAQPNACPDCGPSLQLLNRHGDTLAVKQNAFRLAAEAVRAGVIVALKGLGGFHLVVNVRNKKSVMELRRRKNRHEKPFAVMFQNINEITKECLLTKNEITEIESPGSPITLVRKKPGTSAWKEWVAPENPYLGVMRAYTPLHALLLRELNLPIVATSGNESEDPICTDEGEALSRLGNVAELFLVHDRPIARALDDSVVRIVLDRPLVLRAARGRAPIVVPMETPVPMTLALGGQMKNSVAVSNTDSVILGQHVGDLDSVETSKAFINTINSLTSLYQINPSVVAVDEHPDYFSSQFGSSMSNSIVKVQHHHAHIVSCMADNQISGNVLGLAWDGSGLGPDGSIWGGEFMWVNEQDYKRVGSLRPFPLLGGEQAVREPRRSALGILLEMNKDKTEKFSEMLNSTFSHVELKNFYQMAKNKINSPMTTSMGRLFDGVSALIGLKFINHYEGEAAMALEYKADINLSETPYPFPFAIDRDGLFILDWEPMIIKIWDDILDGASQAVIATRFHLSLIEGALALVKALKPNRVVLSGGCFQNAFLLENFVKRFQKEEIDIYWPRNIPPNDGGLAVGQAVVAGRRFDQKYRLTG